MLDLYNLHGNIVTSVVVLCYASARATFIIVSNGMIIIVDTPIVLISCWCSADAREVLL